MNVIHTEFSNFLDGIPFLEKDRRLDINKALSQYIANQNESNFEEFFMNLTPNVNFKSITPLDLILNMVCFVQKFAKNSTNNIFQNFANDSRKYLSTLIQIPNFIYEDYSPTCLFDDFILFILSSLNDKPLIKNIIDFCIEMDNDSINFFLFVLNQFAFRFSNNFFNPNGHNISESFIILDDLEAFQIILSCQPIAEAFCESDYFAHVMNSLFTKSFIPSLNGNRNYDLCFGVDPDPNIFPETIQKLNDDYEKYYKIMADILNCFYNFGGICLDQTFEFIRSFIKQNINSIDFDEYHEDSMKMLNFEAVIVQLALKSITNWEKIPPFVPYMMNSIVPSQAKYNSDGYDFPLAYVGEYSWVKPSTNPKSLSMIDDNENDVSKDKDEWNQKLLQIRKDLVEPKYSQFLFAALKSISIYAAKLIEQFISLDDNSIKSTDKQLMKNQKAMFKIYFSFNFIIYQNVEFICKSLGFILKTAGVSQEYNQKLPSRPPIAYQHLPEYVLSSCVNLLSHFSSNQAFKYRGYKEYELLGLLKKSINILTTLVNNKKYVRNPIIAYQIFSILSNIQNQNRQNWDLSFINNFIVKVFASAIEFYTRVNQTSNEFSSDMLENMRNPCYVVFSVGLNDYNCITDLCSHSSDPQYIDLVHYLASDLCHYVYQCFNSLLDVQNCTDLLSVKYPYEGKKDLTEKEKLRKAKGEDYKLKNEIKYKRSQFKFYITIEKNLFIILNQFFNEVPEILNEKKVASKLAEAFVAVFQKVLHPEELGIDSPYEFGYDPDSFIRYFPNFACRLSTMINVFVDEFVQLIHNNHLDDLCQKVLSKLQTMSRQNSSFVESYNSFRSFINAAEKAGL